MLVVVTWPATEHVVYAAERRRETVRTHDGRPLQAASDVIEHEGLPEVVPWIRIILRQVAQPCVLESVVLAELQHSLDEGFGDPPCQTLVPARGGDDVLSVCRSNEVGVDDELGWTEVA